jgi:uroporphyrinogen decarboxylase
MDDRERVLRALHHQEPDRIALWDAPWETTIERWHAEGMPADVGPHDYFGYAIGGIGADMTLRLQPEVIEETDDFKIERDADGAVTKMWKGKVSTPELIDYTITSAEEWDRVRDRLVFSPDRVDLEACRNAMKGGRERGYFMQYFGGGIGYDKIMRFVGNERVLVAMAEEPEWILDMFLASARLIVDAGAYLLDNGIEYDGVFIYNDMGYRNGALFSPAMYRTLQKPADAMVFDFFHERGLKVILHSCGCVRELVPDLVDAGLDCLQPLEVKAGMDVVELKKSFGEKLSFMGNIDVRAMAAEDPAVIEEEIARKVPVAMEGGGYVYHSDHSVPDNVSFERYQYVMRLVKEHGTYR